MQEVIKIEFRERCALFARMSSIVYHDVDNVVNKLENTEFRLMNSYDTDGSQAFSFISETDLIVACRGTEPDCWADLKADLRAWPKKSSSGGRVHSGFSWHVSKIWPQIVADLETAKAQGLNVWFTGHSLGGAMATILASRCRHDETLPDPVQLYTFGSPRVGWPKYVDSLAINHVRWVNNNDAVAYLPPRIMGYKHHGFEYYLNAWGNVRSPTLWQRIKDKFRGYWFAWKQGKIDSFSDHSISDYVKHLERHAEGLEVLQR